MEAPTNGLSSAMQGAAHSIGDMFISLSSEYPALLKAILIAFAATGVAVSASAVFDFIKSGRKDGGNQSTGGVMLAKMIGGSGLIDLAFWANVWTASLWALDSPLGIESYAATGGSYWLTALMAVLGFIVLAGYVVLGRAYLNMTKLGYMSPDARSDLIGNIISRFIAGTLMIASLHVAKAIDTSAGFNWIPG